MTLTDKILNSLEKIKIYRKLLETLIRHSRILTNPNIYFECNKRILNPKVCLSEKHIANCKVVSSREELVKLLPKGGVYAEVGVAEGYYSNQILSICKPKKLYMIEYSEKYCRLLKNKFRNEIKLGIVEILQGDSIEQLAKLKDKSLDCIYLDATHDYAHPKKELRICMEKVKDSGFIAGHDYTRFSIWEQQQYGVIEAVNEFVINYEYEFVFLTIDSLSSNPSYVIRKRNNTNISS